MYKRQELQRLPEKCREVFTAIVLENMSYKDVATKLNVSVNTVKTHYPRALKQLRDNIDTIILLILIRKMEKFRVLYLSLIHISCRATNISG